MAALSLQFSTTSQPVGCQTVDCVGRRDSVPRPGSSRSPALAAELVQRKVDLLVGSGSPPTTALKNATSTIPILFFHVGDPIGSGLVAGLARPGGNVTRAGWTGRRHAHEATGAAQASRPEGVADCDASQPVVLAARVVPTEVEPAARSLGVTLRPIELRSPDHIDPAFATLAREPVDALQIFGQPFLFAQGARIAKRAIEQRLPAVIAFQEVARDGILMSCTALDQPFGSTAIGPGAAGCWRALGVTYPLLSRIASSSDPRAGLQSSRVHPFRLVTFEANARSEFDFALGGSRVDAHVGRRTSSFLG